MRISPDTATLYLDGEGRSQMFACLQHAFRWSSSNAIRTIVIFTGTGEGPLFAVQKLMPEHEGIRVVAVTPPTGRLYKTDPREKGSPVIKAGVSTPVRNFLGQMGVPVVSAHLPFKPMRGAPGAEGAVLAEATLSMFGGGLSLCVQSVLVACDAGELAPGERVVAATADTAISVLACRTEDFLSPTEGLLLEHIICRPRRFDISRPHHAHQGVLWSHAASESPALPGPGMIGSIPESDDE